MTKTPLVAALAVLSVAATPSVALASKGDHARATEVKAHRTIRECTLGTNQDRRSEAKRPFRCWEVKNCSTDDVAFIQARFKNGWRVRTWLKRHDGWALGDCAAAATEPTAQAPGRVGRKDGERADRAKDRPVRGRDQDRRNGRGQKGAVRDEKDRPAHKRKRGRVDRSSGESPAKARP
jgi:hypothetical protein